MLHPSLLFHHLSEVSVAACIHHPRMRENGCEGPGGWVWLRGHPLQLSQQIHDEGIRSFLLFLLLSPVRCCATPFPPASFFLLCRATWLLRIGFLLRRSPHVLSLLLLLWLLLRWLRLRLWWLVLRKLMMHRCWAIGCGIPHAHPTPRTRTDSPVCGYPLLVCLLLAVSSSPELPPVLC